MMTQDTLTRAVTTFGCTGADADLVIDDLFGDTLDTTFDDPAE